MRREIIDEISLLHDGKIKYSCARIKKSTHSMELLFITDVAPSSTLELGISEVVRKYLPSSIKSISVEIKKIVTQPEFVKKSAHGFLLENHSICARNISEDNFSVNIKNDLVELILSVEHSACQFLSSVNAQQKLKQYLETQFVESFDVQIFDAGKAEVNSSLLEVKLNENDLRKNYIRKIKVDEVTRLFDNDTTDTASYIADTKDFIGELYLCGIVTDIREMQTKGEKAKTYFIIEFTDRTGRASGVIFPTKDKIAKVQKLAVGSEIIVLGEFEMRNGYHNLRIRSINYCAFPKNFVPVERPKRKAPNEYSVVFPKSLTIETQDNFLVDTSVPQCFMGRTFVVFDVETTGTDTDDKMTEIGAVKIVDGKIESYFESLINPQRKISAEIQQLTGISNEMVEDAPTYEEICADFYKYCDGATLVAHNIEFDSRFIRRQSAPLDFRFENPQLDTLALARECIYGVANYKLNTLCAKFNIVFNHHRAYSDALATAKLFIEIMRIRKEFP